MKLDLVKTCRQWRSIATPLLYEHVSITTESQYRGIVKAFNGGHSDGKKHLISRLDFVCPEVGRAFGNLVDLCNLFKELMTLVASLSLHENDEPSRLLNSLSSNFKNLYVLIHPRDTRGWMLRKLPFSLLVNFLDTHSQLAGFSIPFNFHKTAEENHFDRSWNSKSWPSLKTLVLQNHRQAQDFAAYLPGNAFPRIQSLNGSWDGSGSSGDLRSFVSTHTGQGLLYLSLMISPWHTAALSELLQNLGTLCPALREVHLWLDEHADYSTFSMVGKVPQITTIGVHLSVSMFARGPDRHNPVARMHGLVASPWSKIFPNLRTIRLMEGVDFASYRKFDEVTRRQLCSPGRYVRQPIRVEDCDGQFLAQFTAGISALVEL